MSDSKPDYETRLSDAVEFYRQNPGTKYAPVARKFEVSRDTLRRRVNGGRPAKGRPATFSNLSKAEEEALCDYVDRMNKTQNPISKKDVTDAANSILKERSGELNSQAHTVGVHWTSRFLRRHNISEQVLDAKNKKRKAADNRESVPLDPQVIIQGPGRRPRTPEQEPESLPENTPLRLCDYLRMSNKIIDTLKQRDPTDDLIQIAKKLQEYYVRREVFFTLAIARFEAEERRKTQSPSDGRSSRRRSQLGVVVRIDDARHKRAHEPEHDAERVERPAERVRKRTRRLDEQRSQKEQNQASQAVNEQEESCE